MTALNSDISRFTFSRHIFRISFAGAALACIALAASPVLAAETWIACEGKVTTTPKEGKPSVADAHDVYVLNDANKSLSKYSEPRKSADPVFVTGYDDKAVTWANAGGAGTGSTAAAWEGRLDRAALSLKMTRTEQGESMVWTETCKPTNAK